jgi:hypothetical protein
MRRVLLIGGAALVVLILATIAAYWIFSDRVYDQIRQSANTYLQNVTLRKLGSTTRSNVSVNFGELDYQFFTSDLHIGNIDVRYAEQDTIVDSLRTTTELMIASIDVSGLSWWDVLFTEGLSINTITITEPRLTARIHGTPVTETEIQEASVNDTAAARLPHVPDGDSLLQEWLGTTLPETLRPLTIDEIKIVNGSLASRRNSSGLRRSSRIHGFTMSIKDVDAGTNARAIGVVNIAIDSMRQEVNDTIDVFTRSLQFVISPEDTVLSVAHLHHINVHGTSLTTQGLRLSYRNREIAIDSFALVPQPPDRYFEHVVYRSDRIEARLKDIHLRNIDHESLMHGRGLFVGSVDVGNMYLNILSNRRAKVARNTERVRMPNEAVPSIPFLFAIDSISLHEGVIEYGERHYYAVLPARITFDKMHATITGIHNDPKRDDWLRVQTSARFMKSATMSGDITFPLLSRTFDMNMKVDLTAIDPTVLNVFLIPAESIKIESGSVQSAHVKSTLRNGRASGSVQIVYRNLKVGLLNKKTKKSNILLDVAGFLANWIAIRNDNQPGEDFYTGKIAYTRGRDDAFFQTIWFPVRSGLLNTLGF